MPSHTKRMTNVQGFSDQIEYNAMFFGFDCHMLCEIPVLGLVIATHVWAPQFLDQDTDDADEEDEVHLRERGETGGNIFSLFARWRFSHPHRCKELCSSNKDVMWLLSEEEDKKHMVHVSFLHKNTQMVVPLLFSSSLVHFHTDGQNPAAPETRNCKLLLTKSLILENCHDDDSNSAAVSGTPTSLNCGVF